MANYGWVIVISGLVQAVFTWSLKSWIDSSIKHGFDKKLEQFKLEQSRKQKAAIFAEFLAEWTHVKNGDTKRVNQLIWELSLYLPSELLRDIYALTTKTEGAESAPDLIVAVRNHLLDGQDPIKAGDVVHFKHASNESMVSGAP